jgi:hypothetical protein
VGRGQPHRGEHRQAAGDASKGLNCGSARPKLGPHIGLDPNQLLLLQGAENRSPVTVNGSEPEASSPRPVGRRAWVSRRRRIDGPVPGSVAHEARVADLLTGWAGHVVVARSGEIRAYGLLDHDRSACLFGAMVATRMIAEAYWTSRNRSAMSSINRYTQTRASPICFWRWLTKIVRNSYSTRCGQPRIGESAL